MRDEKAAEGEGRWIEGPKLGKSADEFEGLDGGLPGRSFIPTRRLHHSAYQRASECVLCAALRSESDSTESCRWDENCERKKALFSLQREKKAAYQSSWLLAGG